MDWYSRKIPGRFDDPSNTSSNQAFLERLHAGQAKEASRLAGKAEAREATAAPEKQGR